MTEFPAATEHLPSPQELLQDWRSSSTTALMELTQQVWLGESGQEVWLLGRNESSEILLAQGLACTGVIDDYTSETEWHSLPIQHFEQVATRSAVVINCVQCNQPVEAASRIRASSNLVGLSFSDFYRASLLSEGQLPVFSHRTHEALRDNPHMYDALWQDLCDSISRQSFADILSFRLTTDPWYLRNYSYRPNDQYFEHFLDLPPSPVFIDAGAFQGETSLEFAKRYPSYGGIRVFEPSSANADILVQQTYALHDLELHRVGLSDATGVARFASQMGSASQVSNDGDVEIPMIRLDDLNLSHADLIKMDLEGGEYQALAGSANTILRYNSRLAIASYHHPRHFADIHSLMKQILPGSSIYLRHYTSGWAESVMYCIPQ